MLSDRISILDFDGSVTGQADFPGRAGAAVVDLTAMGPAARLWANRRQADAIRRSLDGALKDSITFLGSGDYHYVSALLLEQFTGPVTLVAFDHHPDWDILPPRHGCGAWVSRALEMGNVSQAVLVGNGSDDLLFPSVLTGNRRAARSGRLLMLPFEAPRRKAWPFGGIPWHELKEDPNGVFSAIVDGLPCRRVYVSIDKDCLTAADALTNWEEGRLSLDLLLSFIRTLRQTCEIVGLDITGEYSPVSIPGRFKSWCSRIDHPGDFTARGRPQDAIARTNGTTNRRLVECLRS